MVMRLNISGGGSGASKIGGKGIDLGVGDSGCGEFSCGDEEFGC